MSPCAIKIKDIIITSLSLLIFIYHLSAALFGEPEAFTFRTTHVFLFLIIFPFFKPLCKHCEKNWLKLSLDALFVFLSVFTFLYFNNDIDALQIRTMEGDMTQLDFYVAIVVMILVLEATRRTLGNIIVIIAIFFIVQTVYSDHFYGILYGPPISFKNLVEFQVYRFDGIYGIPVMVVASFVILYIFFGAFLDKSGAGNFFIDLSIAASSRMVGGPAKAAVISSALMGTLSGSVVANVVTTGSFTIPLMKRIGYPPDFAGAVESVASTGGMIMPPVMGAAAFVMAYFLGISYLQVCIHAAIPACLYFFSVFLMVHFRAKNLDLKPIEKSERPKVSKIFKENWFYFIPLVILIYILVTGKSPAMAAFWALVAIYVVCFFIKRIRMGIDKLLDAIIRGVKTAIVVVTACASAGIIIGSVSLSGLGLRLSGMILETSHQNLWLALILTMICALIMGMGLTATVIYIILSVLVIPAVVEMGIVPVAAHMFCYYYGVISVITPPVAVAAFAAAGISGGSPWKTAYMATRIGITSFLVPFYFVFNTELLCIGTVINIIFALFTAIVGVICLAAGLEGWLFRKSGILERIMLVIASLLLIKPGGYTDIIGTVLLMLVLLFQLVAKKEMVIVAK